MKINDMRVSTRLSAGFCLVLFMMLLMGISAGCLPGKMYRMWTK